MKSDTFFRLLIIILINIYTYSTSSGQVIYKIESGYDLMTKRVKNKSENEKSINNRFNFGFARIKNRNSFHFKLYYNRWNLNLFESYSNTTKYKTGIEHISTNYKYKFDILGTEFLYGLRVFGDSSLKFSAHFLTGLTFENIINYTNSSTSSIEEWKGKSTIKYTTNARLNLNDESIKLFIPLKFQINYKLNSKNSLSTEMGVYFYDKSYLINTYRFDDNYYYCGLKYSWTI